MLPKAALRIISFKDKQMTVSDQEVMAGARQESNVSTKVIALKRNGQRFACPTPRT
jgi:hypothetical protein